MNLAYVGEWLSAFRNFALVRLFACVRSKVYGEGTALDEPLSAILPVASVWPFVCVNAVVSLKIRLSVETLGRRERPSQRKFILKPFPTTSGVAAMRHQRRQNRMISKKLSQAMVSSNQRTNKQTKGWTVCAKKLQKGVLSN